MNENRLRPLDGLDWDDLRFFVAAARAESLSGAAERLGVSVATVGRRIERLEAAIDRRLMHRGASGVTPTEAGEALLLRAEGVFERVTDFLRAAAAAGDDEVGVVHVSTLETVATHVVAPSIAAFRAEHPRVDLVVRGEPRLVALGQRAADIALRVVRPREARVVARRVAAFQYGLYASPDYVARRGVPEDPERTLAGHDLVALDARFDTIPEMAWVHQRAEGASYPLRASTIACLEAAVRHGAGLGILPTFIAGPGLVRVGDLESLPPRDVWLALHEDLRDAPHVRAAADHLAAVCRRVIGAPT